jgi:hypothetical protein
MRLVYFEQFCHRKARPGLHIATDLVAYSAVAE